MKISPISQNNIPKFDKVSDSADVIHTTVRHNSLSDMDFNIIADAIRCQNLKNQMNVRFMKLRRSLNSCMAQNLYNKQ